MVEVYRHMLDELESRRLEVCKLPSRQGGYTRVVVETNAEWYQEFCASYTRARRTRYRRERTIIKRRDTGNALKRLIAGNISGVYAERLQEMAKLLLTR